MNTRNCNNFFRVRQERIFKKKKVKLSHKTFITWISPHSKLILRLGIERTISIDDRLHIQILNFCIERKKILKFTSNDDGCVGTSVDYCLLYNSDFDIGGFLRLNVTRDFFFFFGNDFILFLSYHFNRNRFISERKNENGCLKSRKFNNK